ncbi:hypothetical protein [Bradyrhizobium sp. BR 1433]|uniref:hypothetical protein n=1 Tax=Bradyrhizobium sp. BR 1433 TaxID=3447967 RepID=UPI003EE7E649
MGADEDEPPSVSRTEKRRLHLKRMEAVERRRKQRNEQHCIKPPIHFQARPQEYRRGHKTPNQANFDHEIDDGEPNFIQVEAIIALLKSMDRHRQALTNSETILRKWLQASSEFTGVWNTFVRAGGVSAADFDSFMGGQFQARRIRQKKHLRLVASR